MAIFKPADILIPQNVDFTKWSVVACDQYTSEREYWEDVKNIVGDSPSTLNIIFPEVYLEDGDGDERIKKINSTMEEYINKGIFRELKMPLSQETVQTIQPLIQPLSVLRFPRQPGSPLPPAAALRQTEHTAPALSAGFWLFLRTQNLRTGCSPG